jgi:uncharacterized Zn finger protein (UPF0148 family)
MGMFDNIIFSTKCSECGAVLDDFQSKDGTCILDSLEFWKVDNFYSGCPNCNRWTEFTLKKEAAERVQKAIEEIRKSLTIEDYDREERRKRGFSED